ncbi:hypothetical protein K438DRAFT_1988423 [Mycena galopus ATCC 62051]|nr:hypothetical protein K438DRAFT_1988423 [Mycena galopus ATCC 62051]
MKDTFNSTQGPTDQPTIKDCSRIDDAVADSLGQFTEIIIPPRAYVVLSLFNDSYVLTFLNDDMNDTYDTCVGAIAQDGFLGSYRSAIQPGVQNWEWQCVATPSLSDF